jgi:hypothetical protein
MAHLTCEAFPAPSRFRPHHICGAGKNGKHGVGRKYPKREKREKTGIGVESVTKYRYLLLKN